MGRNEPGGVHVYPPLIPSFHQLSAALPSPWLYASTTLHISSRTPFPQVPYYPRIGHPEMRFYTLLELGNCAERRGWTHEALLYGKMTSCLISIAGTERRRLAEARGQRQGVVNGHVSGSCVLRRSIVAWLLLATQRTDVPAGLCCTVSCCMLHWNEKEQAGVALFPWTEHGRAWSFACLRIGDLGIRS